MHSAHTTRRAHHSAHICRWGVDAREFLGDAQLSVAARPHSTPRVRPPSNALGSSDVGIRPQSRGDASHPARGRSRLHRQRRGGGSRFASSTSHGVRGRGVRVEPHGARGQDLRVRHRRHRDHPPRCRPSRVASPSRASRRSHDDMSQPAPRVLSGNDTLAASDPDPAREARVLTARTSARGGKHRHWNRGDRDSADDVDPATRAQRRDLPISASNQRRRPLTVGSSSRLVLLRRRLLPRGHPRGRLPGCDFPRTIPSAISDRRGSEADPPKTAARSRPRSPHSNITARPTSPTTISPRYSRPGTRARLPVSWACFAARDGDPAAADPAHPGFPRHRPKEDDGVPVAAHPRSLKVLIDVHNMRG